jgi:coproporphyrinogen III oxidase-like Fe-S oxidoreductase
MADKYSVIYDPVAKEPFGIIKQNATLLVAYPIHKTAHNWASIYNSGKRFVPHGMTATDFVEMGCDFVESFKTAFAGVDRVARRAETLVNNSIQYTTSDLVYGVGFGSRTKRDNGVSRKVMPVIQHAQQELVRSRLINQAIRTGKRWLGKDRD